MEVVDLVTCQCKTAPSLQNFSPLQTTFNNFDVFTEGEDVKRFLQSTEGQLSVNMWVMAESTLLGVSFLLTLYFTGLILSYISSKPSGSRTLMDELNQVSRLVRNHKTIGIYGYLFCSIKDHKHLGQVCPN